VTNRLTWLAVVVLGAFLPTLALESLLDAVLFQQILLVLVLAAVMGVGVWALRDRRMPLLSDPYFLLCVFLAQFFVIAPLLMNVWSLGELLFFYGYSPQRPLQAVSACILVMSMFAIGYRLDLGEHIAGALPRFAFSRRKLPGRVFETVLLVACIAACVAWVAYQGGLSAKLSSGYGRFRTGGAMFRIAFVGLQVATLFMGWRIFDARVKRRAEVFLFALVIVGQSLFFGILYGVRKYLLFLFFGLLTIWLLRRGMKALPKVRVAAIMGILLVFFAVWGAIRSKPLDQMAGATLGPRYAENELYLGYVGGVAGPFSVACLVWEIFPDVEPYKKGQTLLVTLLGFIPRAVWPEKPVGIGKEITRYIVGPYYESTHGFSAAATVVGDFYLNWGWFGVLGGGFVLGLVSRTFTAYAVRDMKDGKQLSAARVVIPAAFVMGLGEIRADMATMLATYALTFVPMLIGFFFFNFDASDRDPIGGRAYS
jgi:hypothetical protein